jgi:hypothetical protein
VLKERESVLEVDEHIQKAWEQYQLKSQTIHKKPRKMSGVLLRVASVVLVLFTLMALFAQEANAKNFFGRLIAWTESVFSFIDPAEKDTATKAYVFRTKNPDLQELYEQVVALGITAPVVPSWIPEGYELTECKVTETPTDTYLSASFTHGNMQMVYQLDVFSDNTTHNFYKDSTEIRKEEKNGIEHTIMQNNGYMVAVWTIDNIQCAISMDCHEEMLLKILNTIYTMEVD